MKIWIALFLVSCVSIFFACQKEYSFENSSIPSVGVLQSNISGDCFPKTITGVFEATKILLADSNYITVQVNVISIGSYTIYTDTVNGYYFRATGVFATTGSNQIKLSGIGTPGISGINNFVVHYGVQVCDVAITVLPASAGPAVGSLVGGPGTCASFTLNGIYAVGTALTASHNVQVQLNVTSGGSYNITTETIAGFWFSAAGTVAAGNSTITLSGSGTPASGGSKIFAVKFGSSTCTFTVNVGSAGVGTLGGAGGTCAPITVNGTYAAGTALSPINNTVTADSQKAHARFELRGDVRDYALAARAHLVEHGRFVLCFPTVQRARAEAALTAADLALTRSRDVIPRDGAAPLFTLFACRRVEDGGEPHVVETPHVVRDAQGNPTAAHIAIRQTLGFTSP